MRKSGLIALALVGTLTVAACASSSGSKASSTAAVTTTSGACVSAGLVTAAASTAASGATTSTRPPVPKPKVALPATLPTKLGITDITAGAGDPAATGDTVIVHYVGVLSKDGTEFDNSYDRGEPASITLTAGSAIQGWLDGLVGIKVGGRRQLDIPSALAYGTTGAGNCIKPGDAISFVVDAVAIVKKTDPAAEPKISIPPTAAMTKLETTDLVVGTGVALKDGDHAVAHIQAFRADTGAQINSTWTGGQPAVITLDDTVIASLRTGFVGMKVGGRRQLSIPYKDAFGDTGNANLGLPAKTDLILVIDLIGAY